MSIWKKKYIRPIVYAKYFDEKYGKGKWENMTPISLWSDIKDSTGIEPAENVKEKINALKVLRLNDLFFTDLKLFEKVILAFNDKFADKEMLQVATPHEILYGIRCAHEAVGRKEYDEDVLRYIQGAGEEWGLVVYPPGLVFAQKKLKKGTLGYAIYRDVTDKKFELKPSEWQKKLMIDIKDYADSRWKKGEK